VKIPEPSKLRAREGGREGKKGGREGGRVLSEHRRGEGERERGRELSKHRGLADLHLLLGRGARRVLHFLTNIRGLVEGVFLGGNPRLDKA